MIEEVWKIIPEFSNYQISNLGRIYNIKYDHVMRTSLTNFGHVKISLKSDWSNERFTRSVAQIVAEAFLEPPNWKCDQVIILDGDFSNVAASNLAWRPRWYTWKYTRQLKKTQPIYYRNLAVHNITNNIYYDSIVEAGMTEGLLFEDIWRSTYTGAYLFPNGSRFEVIERV
jgi:hypothetical protein